ncbi:MAG TPA: hypothetical protein VNO52_10270, partial [Methylomirabilota bacterium]|nr:hypothetical protein [Methylomirabilota bacterium]
MENPFSNPASRISATPGRSPSRARRPILTVTASLFVVAGVGGAVLHGRARQAVVEAELARVRQMAVMLAAAGDASLHAPVGRGARTRGQSSRPAPGPVARMQAGLSDVSWLAVVSAAGDRAWHPGDPALSLDPPEFAQWPLSAAELTNMVTSIVASSEAQAQVWRRPGTRADLFVAGAPVFDGQGQVTAVMCLGASAEAAEARVASVRRAIGCVLLGSCG